ncbi:dihydrofolate reductase [Anaerobacillus alkalilacustris]|uniref:Dihydrofolate reductase n=1 Tax=Anaerobacillus alkalilacustris TaxID=393763 RepID=A0A1S2LPF2_9BACI|nr:D-2-hydroxyacid dehydrogenase [Anaerobacillus alkalilacustris]OIJ14388.1 dihydrofolate reductase [Anaerobacillus alkalilacustris]
MKIENILVVSPKFKEIEEIINKKEIQKNIRYLPEQEMNETHLDWADAFVAFNLTSTYDYSKVKWVHSFGAGVDSFLLNKQWPDNVLLTRTICSFGQRIGEYCLSYILKDVQFHELFRDFKKQRKWQQKTPKLLSEQKVLIYGTGEIGTKTAQILASFGVVVYGVSLSGKQKHPFTEVFCVDNHYSILGEVDYIINTLPLTEKTAILFNKSLFSRVSNIGFLNVGRGLSLDEHALLDALNNEDVRFAVLDVFTTEPLPDEHPLWSHPNVWITPHISAVTTSDEGVDCFIETLRNIEANKPLLNKVDTNKGF